MKNAKDQKKFILKELSKWKELYCSNEEEWKRLSSLAIEKLQEAFGDDLEAKLKWLRREGQVFMKDPGACLDNDPLRASCWVFSPAVSGGRVLA